MRYSYKLLGLFLLIALVPLVLVTLVHVAINEEAVRQSVSKAQLETAIRVSDDIEGAIRNIQDILYTTASTPTFRAMNQSLARSYLSIIIMEHEEFNKLILRDTEGNTLAAASLTEPVLQAELAGPPVAEEWREALLGSTVFSDIHFSELKRDPLISVYVPVKAYPGKYIGVIDAEVNLRSVWNDVLEARIGKEGYTYVVDSSGGVIAHPDKRLVLRHEDMRERLPVQRVLLGEKGTIQYRGSDGIWYLTSYSPVESLGWGVIVVQPLEEALAPVEEMKRQAFAIALVIIAIVSVAAAIFSTTITRPIKNLKEGTERIASGDLSHRIEIESQDEIGDLTRAFNEMAARLSRYYSDLEEEVRVRTLDLEKRMLEFRGLYQISELFREEARPEKLSGRLTEKIAELLDVEQCCIILYDRGGMTFSPVTPAYGMSDEELGMLNFSLLDIASTLEEWTGTEPLISNNPSRDRRLMGEFALKLRERNLLLAKLLTGGEFLGILRLANKHAGVFTPEDARLAEIIASRLGAAFHTMMLFEELRESEARLRRYARELEDSNKLKDLFTDIMRHDLLNPVGVIRNYAELMLEEEEDELRRKDLMVVLKNSEKLIAMIKKASTYARLERVEELEFFEADLGAVFREVIEDFSLQLQEKRMRVDYRVRGERWAVVSPTIEDVFSNLLSNAIKYSPEGSRIVVDILDEGEAWKVMVMDQGEGIPDSMKDVIFERFKRGEKTGVKGTGLGLAIVKRIVELHRGRVWVEDNPEGGSIFYVTIPKNLSDYSAG
jgi:signal transduction histidine kinase